MLFAQPPSGLFRSPPSQQGRCSRPQQGLCVRPVASPLRVPLPLGRVLGPGGVVLRQTIMEGDGGEAPPSDGGGGPGDKAQGGEVGKVEKTGRRTGRPWKPIPSVDAAQDGAGVGKEDRTCLSGVVTAHTGNFEGDRDGVIQTLKSATGDKVPLSSSSSSSSLLSLQVLEGP